MATSSEFDLEVAILEQKQQIFFLIGFIVVAVVQLAALHHLDPSQFWSLRWFVEVFWAHQQPVQKNVFVIKASVNFWNETLVVLGFCKAALQILKEAGHFC